MSDRTLIDSNVLLDIVTRDPRFFESSTDQVGRAIRSAEAVINPLILAEVSAGFNTPEEVDQAFPAKWVRREPLPWSACFPASQAYRRYRREHQGQKTSPLPDFFIGAHALVAGMKLLTRDVQRYRTYFPDVELISPE